MKLMTSLLKQEGLMVLESEELTVPVEETPADQIDTDAVAAEIVSDIDAGADDVEEAEQTEEAVVELESLVQSLESALANGGITAREGKYAQMAGNLLVKQIGLESATVLSTEQFGGIGSRYDSTKLVMESFGDKVKAGYDKVVEWVKKMIAKMKDLWVKVKNFARGIGAKCEKLEARVEALDSETSVVSGFTDDSLPLIAQYVFHEGDKGFGKLPERAQALGYAAGQIYGKYVKDSIKELELEASSALYRPVVPQVGSGQEDKMPGAVSFEETGNGSGVYKFVVKAVAKPTAVVGTLLSKSDLKNVLKNVALSNNAMVSHESNWEALEKAVAKFESTIKAQSDEKDKVGDVGFKHFMAQANGVYAVTSEFTKYNVLVMKNMLKYVELVLDNWGGKKAAAPAQA